jgi:hypothetical protein
MIRRIILYNVTEEKDGGTSFGGRYVAETLTKKFGIEAECTTMTKPGDFIVGWGWDNNQATLNGRQRHGKLWEIETLARAGVNVPPSSRTLVRGWLGRNDSHSGGKDLLNPPSRPYYWVKFIETTVEYRIHLFFKPDGSVSYKPAVRMKLRPDAHPWMRNTWEGGWNDEYLTSAIQEESRRYHVDFDLVTAVSARAVRAVGFHFGAVDVAWTGERPIVWEVNSQPYIAGPETAMFYAKNIKLWYDKR